MFNLGTICTVWNDSELPPLPTPLRIYRRVFTEFLEVPSPPWSGGEGEMPELRSASVRPMLLLILK